MRVWPNPPTVNGRRRGVGPVLHSINGEKPLITMIVSDSGTLTLIPINAQGSVEATLLMMGGDSSSGSPSTIHYYHCNACRQKPPGCWNSSCSQRNVSSPPLDVEGVEG